LKFARAIHAGEAHIEVWGTGHPVREWLFVRDLARIIRHVIEVDAKWTEPVNIAQRRGWTVRDLVDLLRKASGYTGSIAYNTAYGDGAPTKVMDDRWFRRYFPTISFTSIAAGIQQSLAYYAETLKKDHEHLLL
jgi:GDP-L-fucose synthase